PPRIDAKTVDFERMQAQPGDEPRPVMSYLGHRDQHPQQVSCYITHTNERTHDIIRNGLDRSPMYSGVIEGVGPRYCPSIEDKIMRFADKNSHQVFIEPEGLQTHELYPNGISTSLPFDVQLKVVQSMQGMERAFITRPGYAIEYDYLNPQDLKLTMETKFIQGLFLAGQINGTTGYEEAAAQGLLAGLNASLLAQDKDGWYPRRDEAYIGVLMDDLITMGTEEPYRMFTSRAEFRLILREDNADLRLTEKGRELGLVDDVRWKHLCEKREATEKQIQYLRDSWVQPDTSEAKKVELILGRPLRHEYSLYELIKRPELNYAKLDELLGLPKNDQQVEEQVETQIKYEGYISRQLDEVEKLRKNENTALPEDMEYEKVKGLSNEAKQKLSTVRPETIGQATRISGITPATISLLLIHLKKKNQLFKVSA
ncbi:MAG: tRNA uridine-5-carboxymethylaminomethyl(34) synthesis enzyme MnmG, partial [Gammaproteobacteria bacterium]|nr:tRNA uridine-5-carboxymethylaminomethyl(34) synthesis enzyme MnmG [Gammaproteobacteria bacterium]